MADKNKHLSCARNATYLQRAHNVPRTSWNVRLACFLLIENIKHVREYSTNI